MRTTITARPRLLFTALLCLVLLNCQGPDARQQQLQALQAELQACQSQRLVTQARLQQQQAQLDYEYITRNPASSWTTDSLTGYLSDPYRVHSAGPGR